MIEPSSVLFKASGTIPLLASASQAPQHVRMACRRVGSSSEEERGNSSKSLLTKFQFGHDKD